MTLTEAIAILGSGRTSSLKQECMDMYNVTRPTREYHMHGKKMPIHAQIAWQQTVLIPFLVAAAKKHVIAQHIQNDLSPTS